MTPIRVVRTSKDNDIEPVYGTKHGIIMMKKAFGVETVHEMGQWQTKTEKRKLGLMNPFCL